MIKPSTVAGTMELLPAKQLVFNKMLSTIKECYKSFGYTPLETPLLEKSSVLLTKSGGETEKQIYFAVPTGSLDKLSTGKNPKYALKFDLTVPLARYVAQHENDLVFPFKRYQIQQVYRGESAQKGRYREFYQCDLRGTKCRQIHHPNKQSQTPARAISEPRCARCRITPSFA